MNNVSIPKIHMNIFSLLLYKLFDILPLNQF